MAIKVPSADKVADKWSNRVSVAGPDYEAGVSDPSVDWAGPAKAAESTYKEAVVQAANEGRYGKGVSAAGNDKWRNNAIAKGPSRWTDGVSKAKGDYSAGMNTVLNAISSVTLPPRYPAGDERNYERVKAVGRAVHNATKK